MRAFVQMLVKAAKDWMEDKAPRLAASLSYYTVFSLPPLLVVLVGIAGIAFGEDAVRNRMVAQISGLVGPESAQLLGEAIGEARRSTGTGWALAVGVLILVFAAAGVFGQLQDAQNTIWEVPTRPGGGLWGFAKKRLLSLGAVLGAGFLLLVSLAVSTATGALVDLAGGIERFGPFLAILDTGVSLVVITALFALIFMYLPDVEIKWRDVWVGAFVTACLFVAGKFAIELYIATSNVGSAYGAAGSLIIILVWIYYSSMIVFFGAELTQVWSSRDEASSRPVPGAESAPHLADGHVNGGEHGPGTKRLA